MTTIEQRLRAAFAAADTALRDHDVAPNRGNAPIGGDVDNPAGDTTTRSGKGHRRDDTGERRTRRGHVRFAPIAAAAASVALVAGIAWTAAERHTSPAANSKPTRTGLPSISPTRPPPTASASQVLRPLPGPGVSQARLLPGGHGYVLTGTRLLATTDYARSWIDQTPAGVSAAQLAGADVQIFDDTHAWLAVADTRTTGPLTATVHRRSGATWQKATATATGLPTLPGMQVNTYLSFATATDGWLAITGQVTSTPWGALLRTTDAGATWSPVASSSAQTAALPGVGPVDFVTSTVGWMTEPWSGRTWMTRNGGKTWAAFTLPRPAGQAGDVATLLAMPQRSGPRLVTAVSYAKPVSGAGDVVVLYTSSDETSWSVLASVPRTGNEDVVFAAAPDQDTQVLLGLNGTGAGTAPSWIVSLIQGGTVNAASSSVVPAGVIALAASDSTHLWAVVQSNGCTNGKSNCFSSSGLFTTSNAGRDWTLARPPT